MAKELVPDDDPSRGLGDFYDFLWGEQDGYVYLPNKDRTTDEWQKIMFSWPQDRARVITYTLATAAQGKDVYAAPAIFKEKRPVKDNVKGVYTLWVDFDGNAPASWPENTLTDAQEGATSGSGALKPSAPPPTLQINSSRPGHEHVYWRLSEFTTDPVFIENTNRALAYKYEADTSGWDLGQVLRPPYTTNYKHDLPVTVSYSTEHEYSRQAFAGFQKVKQLVSDAIKLKEIPEVTKVIAKYQWDDSNFALFMKPEVEEGKRSSALMALGYFGAETGMADEEIYALLINADDRWGKFKNRNDREKRLLDIINRARQKHPVGVNSEEGLLRGLLASAEDVETSANYVFGFAEFNKLDIKLEWVIEGLIERKGMGIVVSAPGVGKTQWSLGMAMSCALGENFLIWPVHKKMKILWFSLEMNGPALQYFTKIMATHYSPAEMETLDRNLKIVPMGETLPLDRPEGRQFLETLIEEYQPDGIIIDSMGKVTNKSLNDEEMAKKLANYYAMIRNKYDMFVYFVHHNRKANGDNKKPKDLADVYGNQYITADVSSAISLWKEDAGEVEVNVIKSRLAREVEPFNVLRTDALRFVLKSEMEGNMFEDSALAKEGTNGRGPKPGSSTNLFDL